MTGYLEFPTRLAALTQAQLVTWAARAQTRAEKGRLPDYIPLLAKADRRLLAVQVQRIDGQMYQVGNVNQPFVLMSVMKPLLLLFLLETIGQEAVFARVGVQPSDQPFHSVAQLMNDRSFPRNPMINSGAIALTALVPGETARDRCDRVCDWLNRKAGCRLTLDEVMLDSVRSLSNETNRSLANLLAQSGFVESVEMALDTYNHLCCLASRITDLVRLGLLLAHPQGQITPSSQRIVNALMLTCGLYEASAEYTTRIGLPLKSGVSGALLAVVPREGAIACYSPALDETGNSIAGLLLLEQLAQGLNLSVFG